ncbi:MAG: hypothetical protein MZU91_01770 [Desulfosudis oleivorans]|nr:hypothetical protein [Desulfosudis oleivorans]
MEWALRRLDRARGVAIRPEPGCVPREMLLEGKPDACDTDHRGISGNGGHPRHRMDRMSWMPAMS